MSKHTFKNTIFALDEKRDFLLIKLGICETDLAEKFTNREIYENFGLECINPTKGIEEIGIYKGDFIMSFSQDYWGNWEESITIENLIYERL